MKTIPASQLANHMLALALAIVALVCGTGCTWDLWANATGYDPDWEEPHYMVKCESNRLQLYQTVLSFGSVRPEAYTLPVDSPINNRPCTVSTEDIGQVQTISEAIDKGLLPSSQAPPPLSATGPSKAPTLPPQSDPPTKPWLQNTLFRNLTPSIFPPQLSAAEIARAPQPCPAGLAAYKVNHRQNSVTSFGICPMRVLRDINVAPNPLQIAITPDGKTAIVTSYDEALTFIDTATDTARQMSLINYNPSGIAISPDGTRAYVTHYLDVNPSLLVIDIPNRRLLSTIRLPLAYPRTVILTPDGSQAWVNYFQGGVISVVDLLTESIAGSVQITQPVATGMVFNPSATKAYAAVSPNQVYVINTSTLAIQKRLTVGQSPMDLKMSVSGARLFVTAEFDPAVWLIDPRTDTVLRQMKPPPDSAAATGGGRNLGLLLFR